MWLLIFSCLLPLTFDPLWNAISAVSLVVSAPYSLMELCFLPGLRCQHFINQVSLHVHENGWLSSSLLVWGQYCTIFMISFDVCGSFSSSHTLRDGCLLFVFFRGMVWLLGHCFCFCLTNFKVQLVTQLLPLQRQKFFLRHLQCF